MDYSTFIYTAFTATITFFVIRYFDDNNKKNNKNIKNTNQVKQVTHFDFLNQERSSETKSVYVAGAWIHRVELQDRMDDLRKKGFKVTSNWPGRENRIDTPDDYAECSKYDLDEVCSADTILAFMTDKNYAYRGTGTEIGCAIGTGRRVIVVCDGTCEKESETQVKFSHYCMRNVFFWDPRIEHVSCYEDAVKLMSGQKVESPYKHFYTGKITKCTEGIGFRNDGSNEQSNVLVQQPVLVKA